MLLRMNLLIIFLSSSALCAMVTQGAEHERQPLDVDWYALGRETLQQQLRKKLTHGIAMNVILFIGDGLSDATITAARIYKGQKAGRVGEMENFAFERFPHVGQSQTYANDMQVTESAAGAAAILTGTKVTGGTLGCGPKVERYKCHNLEENKIQSILDWSMAAGKGTGIVTNTRITHATPAAAYAHTANRNWESDSHLSEADTCTDVAYQLIMENSDINVIMGGGRKHLLPNTVSDPEGGLGSRSDGLDLIQAWQDDKEARNLTYEYVWKQDDFADVDTSDTDYLLGLFSSSHMAYELDRSDDVAGEPSLAEMTRTAIEILSRHKHGYFLLVEGGRIDHAHHACQAKKALEDTISFDDAVAVAADITNERDTLIIVTADHAHTLSMTSFSSIDNPILGVADTHSASHVDALDGFPYLTLSYADGPGYLGRVEATEFDSSADDFQFPVRVPIPYSTHGGENVAIYARGPMSHLVNGVVDNHYLAHVMAYASCVGQNQSHCKVRNRRRSSRS